MNLNIGFLTERGWKVLLILLACCGLAALFVDPFLVALALSIGGFLFYDYKKAKRAVKRLKELVKFNSNSVRVVLVAGQSKIINLSCQATTELVVSLSFPLKEARIRPDQIRGGKYNLELLVSSELSGNYTADKIKAEVFGPYRLTKKEGNIPFDLSLKVLPRVMVVLVRATLFLLREGRGGAGEIPVPFKGPGTEYADTREYIPGDTLHHVDWKATARCGRLMVKEFFREAGQGAHVIYDIRAAGPVSQDKLATNFLNTCLGAAEQGYPLGVTVQDGEKVILHSVEQNPRKILKMAMGYVLESMKVDLEDIDILIDPFSSFEIKRFLNRMKEKKVKKVLEFEAKVIRNRLSEPYRFLAGLSRQMNEERQFLLISQLAGEIVDILQLIDEIRRRHQLIIIQPAEPWREAENLEKAYRWYERMKKIERILGRRKVQVVSRLGS